MKFNIVPLVAAILTFFASCSKHDINTGSPEKVPDQEVQLMKVENGLLTFKNYEAFFSALSAQSNLTNSDREKWEQSIGFTSMRTRYERFKTAVNHLDNSVTKKEQYDNNDFLKIVERYKSSLTPTDQPGVYNLNCSGLLESGLVNDHGIVKVENDIIYFGKSQIVSFLNKTPGEVLNLVGRGTKFYNGKDNSIHVNSDPDLDAPFSQTAIDSVPRLNTTLMSVGNEVMNISSVAIPNGQRFAVRNQAWNSSDIGGDGIGSCRIRLFAIQIPNNTIRGFVTAQMYCTAKNWLGTRRKIKIVGFTLDGQVDLIIQPQFAHNLVNIDFQSSDDQTFTQGTEDHEVVFLASKVLKENSAILGQAPGIPYANQTAFANCPHTINDDYLDTGGQWWGNVFTNSSFTTLVTTPLNIFFIAMGKGPLPDTYEGTVLLTNGNE